MGTRESGRWRRRSLLTLLGALLICALAAGPASAAPWLQSAPNILPDPSFTITPAAPYPPGQSLTFTANSTVDPNGGTLSYAWTVDGNSTPVSTASSFSQSFTSGAHSITLAVTDSEGDPTQTSTQPITVDTLPDPSFTITPAAPYPPGQSLTFTANSTTDPNGGTLSYAWTVDGTPIANTTSSFSQSFTSGAHSITLAVTDSEGDPTQTSTQNITVDTLPDASFTITPTAPYVAGESLTFTANSTTDPNGGTLSYAWTVDGNPTPVSTASSFSQTFTIGSHSITLAVTDSEGDPIQTTTQPITVFSSAPPTARFTVSGAAEGSPATFDPSSSSDPNPGATITTYQWDFGDGTTLVDTTGAAIQHTYPQAGSYTATLTVIDNSGRTSSPATHTVAISDATAVAAFTLSPASPSVGTLMSFAGTRSGDPDDAPTTTSYAWSFGDGAQASGASVQHAYQQAGTYTVLLTITDSDGQASTIQRVHVAALAYPASAPRAVFTAPRGSAGSPTAFDGSRSVDPNPGGSLSYRWTFGDGGVSAGARATHTFRTGSWSVTLTVTDNATNQSNSVSHTVTIGAAGCVVPALKGKRLVGARGALTAARCTLGRVTGPKRPARSPGRGKIWARVVVKQSARVSGVHPRGFAVGVNVVWRAVAG